MADQVNESVKDVIEQTSSVASNSLDKAKDIVNDVTKSGTENVKNTITQLSTNSGTLIGLVIVIVVAIISTVVIYWFIVNRIFKKKSIIIEKTKIPIKGFTQTIAPIEFFPNSENGFKKTYTFWIYLDNMNVGNNMYKHVFHIGNEDDTVTNGTPYVFIDKTTNSLYIRFSKHTNFVTDDEYIKLAPAINNTHKLHDINDILTYMQQGVKIDYLPMQRWVHVVLLLMKH